MKLAVERFNQTQGYRFLTSHALQMREMHLRQLFEIDPNRARDFSIRTPHAFYDYSRQRVALETMNMLTGLAQERNLQGKINSMFAGETINTTEGRAVLHTALRDASHPEVQEVLGRIENFSAGIPSNIKNILAIGIGGSYLGPEYLATALRPYAKEGMNLRFIANVDGTDFVEKTAGLNPEETMVVVISKTFTTAETMKNAQTAKEWITLHLGSDPEIIKKHFVAVSTAKEKVEAFGIDPENMFGFWDWVGGRYSATSAVGGVPLSLYLGFDNFKKVLEGAHWMDQHFRTAPLHQNIPVISALLDIWNINFLGLKTRALLPYSQGLAKLPAHTQQVEMESNGKRIDLEGREVEFDTGEVVFGGPCTNAQHSYFQSIHQGTQIIPCDFIGFIELQYQLPHHDELMTNFFAQADALAFGKDNANPHKNFPGNRPSSSLLLQKLDPFTAGLLLAWTEHRAAVKGFMWGINSFDQFGVELGKVLGVDMRGRMQKFYNTGEFDTTGLNPSTANMFTAFLNGTLPQLK